MSKLEDQLRKQRGTNLDTDRVEKNKKKEEQNQQEQRSRQEHSREGFDKKSKELLNDMFQVLLEKFPKLKEAIKEMALAFSLVKKMNLEGVKKGSLGKEQRKALAEKMAQGDKSGKGEKTDIKNNKEEMGRTLAEGAGLRKLREEIDQLGDKKEDKLEKSDSAKTEEQQEKILKKIEEALNRTDAEDHSETTPETKKKKRRGE